MFAYYIITIQTFDFYIYRSISLILHFLTSIKTLSDSIAYRTNSSGAPQKLSPRPISSEASQKKSSPQPVAPSETPQKISPRVVRRLKTSLRCSDHTASSSSLTNRAPKVAEHKSPKSPLSEKKRPSKVSELESQISQLENDLKIVKDQLCTTEAQKNKAQKDADESNQQLLVLSLKLKESEKHISEHSSSEEIICEKADPKLQSELEAVKEQSSHDSVALAAALDEIKQLKTQLESVAESEATHFKKPESDEEEVRKLKENLSEAFLVVEEMKNQVKDSKESEAQAQARVGETLVQLESAKKMVETLRSDGLKAMDDYNAVASELEQSRAHVNSLEKLVSKLKTDISSGGIEDCSSDKGDGVAETEVKALEIEVEQLRSALRAAEIRYSEEQSRSVEQIENALDMVEKIKSSYDRREVELEKEIQVFKNEIEELKANLMDKETELQGICGENEGLTAKLESSLSSQRETELEKKINESKEETENLKASLMEKETEWVETLKEKEKLKIEMKETSKGGIRNEAMNDAESARAGEREALVKVGYMMDEVDKSERKAAMLAEQLEAAQAANAAVEAELRRLKVQSDQWRKAAEVAAAMLSAGNNGQIMERTGSMDCHYSPRTGKISSPCTDDLDEELMKKKNVNMLRRFGVLWKKPRK